MASVGAETGHIDVGNTRQVGQVRQGFTRFAPGDVLFAKITPCMENGKIAVVPDLQNGVGVGSTEFHVLAASEVSPPYLYYWVSQRSFREAAEFNMTGTAGQKRVPTDFLRHSVIPVPSADTQRRIVAHIEALSADLDDGEAALERARGDLVTWRQALLKAAVTGELTADWRAANPPTETGADLLARILAKRRTSWLAEPRNKGKRYVEPNGAKLDRSITLPVGWTWATIEQLCSADRPVAYGVLQPGEDAEDGIALVRVMDIADGCIAASQLKKIDPSIAAQYPRTRLKGGEVLLTVVGSIGRTAVVPKQLAGANTARAVSVLPIEYALPEWIELALRFEPYRSALENASHEVARKTLNLEDVRAFELPLPPEPEQIELVRLIRTELTAEAELKTAKKELGRGIATLRQSILAAAFRGDLVA